MEPLDDPLSLIEEKGAMASGNHAIWSEEIGADSASPADDIAGSATDFDAVDAEPRNLILHGIRGIEVVDELLQRGYSPGVGGG